MYRVRCDDSGISRAARAVRDGGVVIFPTDTVYGIGCDPYNAEAVGRVYEIKSRDFSKPLPVLVDSIRTALLVSSMDDVSMRIAERFWPGPLTIILDVTDQALTKSLRLEQGRDGIALRIPSHACTRRLLDACRMIAGTSANLSGAGSTGDPDVCADSMSGYDVMLDGGMIDNPAESTVIDARMGRIEMVREGRSLSLDDIRGAAS